MPRSGGRLDAAHTRLPGMPLTRSNPLVGRKPLRLPLLRTHSSNLQLPLCAGEEEQQCAVELAHPPSTGSTRSSTCTTSASSKARQTWKMPAQTGVNGTGRCRWHPNPRQGCVPAEAVNLNLSAPEHMRCCCCCCWRCCWRCPLLTVHGADVGQEGIAQALALQQGSSRAAAGGGCAAGSNG